MAYRRKPQPQPPPSFEHHYPPAVGPASPDSLAAQAMRASAAHRDASSLASAYSSSASMAASRRSHHEPSVSTTSPDCSGYEYTSMKSLNEAKYGFWGTLARKAKSFLDEDCSPGQYKSPRDDAQVGVQLSHSKQLPGETKKSETPPSQRTSESISSSLTYIGGTIKNALEEGRTIVENKTADIIQETRKLNIRRKGAGLNTQGEAGHKITQIYLPQNPLDHETQLKASRDVANAMAAKAKLLLRELKTVKADLAFAKERCAQLEEENKMLRESYDKGDNPEDDDMVFSVYSLDVTSKPSVDGFLELTSLHLLHAQLVLYLVRCWWNSLAFSQEFLAREIRLQLETLLAEKARLAHENSIYARENRFLREIVEYHQLTMQDVIYVDEGIEEVTEVYPTQVLPRTGSSAATPATPKSASTSTSAVPESCLVVPAAPKLLSRASLSNRAKPPHPTLTDE